MNETTTHGGFSFLQKASLVLLVFQSAAAARMMLADGGDIPTGLLLLAMSTALFGGLQGRMARDMPEQAGLGWLMVLRTLILLVLTLATMVVVFYRLLPPGIPALTQQTMFSALWLIIALKGAALGKLKPNRVIGLQIPWTRTSRLAWDKAHRVLGRILFWGGLAGLAVSFVLPPLPSIALWFATIAGGVAMALMTSHNTWRTDPDRQG